jgi:negative regulator of flagellin synthesis FlgM
MAGTERLEGLPKQPYNISPSEKAPPTSKATNKPLPENQHTDSVEISRETAEYQQLLKQIDQIPDIRQDRLEKIKKVLKDGSYHIDSDIVANRIIQEVLNNEIASNRSSELPPSP